MRAKEMSRDEFLEWFEDHGQEALDRLIEPRSGSKPLASWVAALSASLLEVSDEGEGDEDGNEGDEGDGDEPDLFADSGDDF